jgi:hypothetical protein
VYEPFFALSISISKLGFMWEYATASVSIKMPCYLRGGALSTNCTGAESMMSWTIGPLGCVKAAHQTFHLPRKERVSVFGHARLYYIIEMVQWFSKMCKLRHTNFLFSLFHNDFDCINKNLSSKLLRHIAC